MRLTLLAIGADPKCLNFFQIKKKHTYVRVMTIILHDF